MSTPSAKRWRPYVAFVAFAVLSAVRDAGWARYFAAWPRGAAVSVSLFSGCLATFLVGGALVARREGIRGFRRSLFPYTGGRRHWMAINAATVGGYVAYLAAAGSSIGPGLASFVDFALGPFCTLVAAAWWLSRPVERSTAVAATVAAVGVALFFAPRLAPGTARAGIALGLAFALGSAVFGGVFRVFSKKALDHGLSKVDVLVGRFYLLTLVTGAWVCFRPVSVSGTDLLVLAAWGTFGFTVPLLLYLVMLEALPIESAAMLGFLVPLLTCATGAYLGVQPLFRQDALGAILVLGAVVLRERRRRSVR